MAFDVKPWENYPSQATPRSADAMIDLETRLSEYTDAQVGDTSARIDAAVLKDRVELHVEDRGAVAGQDSRTAIQQALTDLGTAGGGTLRGTPGKFYKLPNGLGLTQPSNVRIDGLGLDVSAWTSAGAVLGPTGTLGTGIALTANAAEGDTTLTAASWTGLAVGDHIRIEAATLYGTTSQPVGERQRVKAISGTTLTLYSPLRGAYVTADTAQVKKISDVVAPVYEDLHILGPTDTTVAVQGILATLCRGLQIKPGCVFERTHQRAVGLVDVLDARVTAPHFASIEQSGFAYGVSIAGACEDITISNMTVQRSRHGVTVGGGASFPGIPRNITMSTIVGKDMIDALVDCHPAGECINLSNAQIDGGENDGFVFQGTSGEWTELSARNVTRHGLLIQPSTIKPLNFRATGRFRKCGSRGVQVSAVTGKENWARLELDVDVDGALRGIDLANATSTRWNGVTIAFSARNIAGHPVILQKVGRITVTPKDVEVSTASTGGVYVTDGVGGEIGGGNITGSSTSSTRCVRLESVDRITVHDIRGTGCQFGVSTDNASTNCNVHDNDMTGNTTPFSPGTGAGHRYHDNTPGQVVTVASAASIALSGSENDIYKISGTTTIDTITALEVGRRVTLITTSTAGLSDGVGNLKLAGAFTGTADDAITLVCDGTNWFEQSRSAN